MHTDGSPSFTDEQGWVADLYDELGRADDTIAALTAEVSRLRAYVIIDDFMTVLEAALRLDELRDEMACDDISLKDLDRVKIEDGEDGFVRIVMKVR